MKNIIPTNKSNLKEWVQLSLFLFPDTVFEEMFEYYNGCLNTKKEIGFLYRKDNKYIAFMNLSVRTDYVNGTNTSPIVFIEAIYVLPEYRKQGIAKKLIAFAEKFTKNKGFSQLASDCLISNSVSEQFHRNCGFEEKERVICFVKNINNKTDITSL